MKKVLLALSVLALVGCGRPARPHVESTSQNPVKVDHDLQTDEFDWEEVGVVDGEGHTGFRIYKVKVDSVTYIIASDFDALTLLDKR